MAKLRKPSALFRHIERLQGDRPWGWMLDAGTGVNSLRWVSGLETDRWTAVAGSARERDFSQEAVQDRMRSGDQVIAGNWGDPDFLKGESFDTVLADYLLGAIEGFAPYFQPYLFARLRPLTKDRLYITGLEPYVPTHRPEDAAGRVVWEIGRFRDSCMLLSGVMPYREYPALWVCDRLRESRFSILKVKHFDIRHGPKFVDAQINLCAPSLDRIEDRSLAEALRQHGESLRQQAHKIIDSEGALRTGQNYVIAAKAV
ncbi:MAG: class I SAM-dependent methyltransferase [Pseudomonadota bacterium]